MASILVHDLYREGRVIAQDITVVWDSACAMVNQADLLKIFAGLGITRYRFAEGYIEGGAVAFEDHHGELRVLEFFDTDYPYGRNYDLCDWLGFDLLNNASVFPIKEVIG